MKRHIVTVSLLGTMLGAGTINSQASPPPNHPDSYAHAPAGDIPPPNEIVSPPIAALKHEKTSLQLSVDQEKKIADILAEEREKISPLLKKLDTLRRQLHQAEMSPTLDEPGLHLIAEGLSKTETELIMSHAKMNRRVMAVLSADQRELLAKQTPEREFSSRPPRPERETGSDTRHGR